MTTAPLNAEMLRILHACQDGRLKLNMDRWRWYIEGEDAPASADRKHLVACQLLVTRPHGAGYEAFLTPKGLEVLADVEARV